MYLIDLKKETSQLIRSGATSRPSPRWEHASVFHNGILYVIGGTTKESYNDIYALDIKEETWTQITPSGITLPQIYGHTATVAHGKIYIIGGYLKDDIFNPDVYIYDIETNKLSKFSKTGLKPRAFHSSSLIGNYIYVIGGLQGENNLVDKVQILQTLKNQVIDAPIEGKFPARQNHCAVVDDKGRNIVIFGGISAKRWGSTSSRNDVIILDTNTDAKTESNAPLSQRLNEILIDINSENFNRNFTEQIEQQLLSQIDSETRNEFDELPQRISNCKEIELLYHEMVNTESNRRDIIGQSKMYFDEIKKISYSFVTLRDQLLRDASIAQDKLNKLGEAENQLIQSQQFHKQAKQDEILAREQKQQAKKQLAIIQGNISKAKAQITSAEAKRLSAIENQQIYNKMLETSDHDYILKKDEEHSILEKIGEFESQIGIYNSEIENIKAKIVQIQNSIQKYESELLSYKNLPIDLMRTLYENGESNFKQLLDLIQFVLKHLQQHDLEAPGGDDLDQYNPDRILLLVNKQVDSLSIEIKSKQVALEKYRAELLVLTQKLEILIHENAKWKRKHEEIEKAINQINVLKTDSDKKRADLESKVQEAENIVLEFQSKILKLEIELKTIQADIEKYNNDERLNIEKREKELTRDVNLQKEIRQLKGELEDMSSDLRRKYKEAIDIQLDLSEMRTSISVSKELFDQQSVGVNEARNKLLRKLSQSSTCIKLEEDNKALEKENLELKKRISQLEQQLASQ